MAAPAFTLNRAEVVDRNFAAYCAALDQSPAPPRRDPRAPLSAARPELTGERLLQLAESQFLSRHLDLMARELRRQNRGYYTIGSSGHEGNAVLGATLRFSDPAFLHYRAGALLAERSRQVPSEDFVRNSLLSLMAAREDPISGGRHKVWGSVPMCVIPQTSTIASHLPRSVGAALAIERSKRLGTPAVCGAFGALPPDAISLCTFGDATTNHSVAQGAFNLAAYAAFQNLPAPVLFVCEDNGIGISVHTATNWIETSFTNRPGIRYFSADGLDLIAAYEAAAAAADYVRSARRPAFLHLRVVRLLGHAGTDPETEYHTLAQIEAAEARDPLLGTARNLVERGLASGGEILALYEQVRRRVAQEAERLGAPAQLSSAAEVIAPLAPLDAEAVRREARRGAAPEQRLHAFALDSTPGFVKGGSPRLPENQPARHLAVLINWALRDLAALNPNLMLFGEDVAARGGVYYVTAGLSARFGLSRVFNTLLDETSILGMAIGAGHLGLLPMPEIQYLAYVHNAIDQLRGEACSAQYFSNNQFPSPMVVRIQSLGYQKGFGGHFHNDNSIAALRDIPALIVCVPARGDDAVRLLRTCVALAKACGRVVAFLEPIALYMTKDLYETGDGLWLSPYPPPGEAAEFGAGRVYYCGADGRAADTPAKSVAEKLTILTFGNGVYMSLRAARMLYDKHGVAVRVSDLRWVSPLNEAFILEQADATGRVLVVDEGRRSGGVSEAILSLLQEQRGGTIAARRITGADTYIPLGPAANLVLPTEEDVVQAALALAAERN